MTEPTLILCATVSRPKRGRESTRACGVLLDVVEAIGAAVEDEPLILEHLPDFFGAALVRLLDEDHLLRIDLPTDLVVQPRQFICRTQKDIDTFMRTTGGQFTGPMAAGYYPLSVWRMSRHHFAESSAAIDGFRKEPGDEAEFAKILAQKIWRVAVFPSSMTLSVPCDYLDQAEILIRDLLSDCPLYVDWA